MATKKKSAQARGKMSRAKGARGERKVIKILKDLFSDFDRRPQYRGGLRDGPDIFSDLGKLDVEVKHRAHGSIPSAIRDARDNCREGHRWLAVDWPTAGQRKGQPVVVMALDEFVSFVLEERATARALGYDEGYDDARAIK